MREPRPDWSPLQVNFKILDEHPHLFHIGVLPPWVINMGMSLHTSPSFLKIHSSYNLLSILLFQDLRIATTVAVVIGLFVICWTPFFTLNLASSVCLEKIFMSSGCQGLAKLPPVVTTATKALWYANSICNPIIYGLRNNKFRRTFRRISVALFCKKTQIVN